MSPSAQRTRGGLRGCVARGGGGRRRSPPRAPGQPSRAGRRPGRGDRSGSRTPAGMAGHGGSHQVQQQRAAGPRRRIGAGQVRPTVMVAKAGQAAAAARPAAPGGRRRAATPPAPRGPRPGRGTRSAGWSPSRRRAGLGAGRWVWIGLVHPGCGMLLCSINPLSKSVAHAATAWYSQFCGTVTPRTIDG